MNIDRRSALLGIAGGLAAARLATIAGFSTWGLEFKKPRPVYSAFATAKEKIVSGLDCSILICADSNANASNEYVYKFAIHLSSLYSTHSVIYSRWVGGGDSWEEPIALSTGSTEAKLCIWNCANPGTRPDFVLGSRYFLSHQVVGPDAVVLGHGGNMYVGVPHAAISGMYYEYLGKVAETFPRAGFLIIKGQPTRDDNSKAPLFRAFDATFAKAPAEIIDVNAIVTGLGKNANLYEPDGVHLSERGQDISYVALIKQAWDNASVSMNAPPPPQWTQEWTNNLIQNGDFAAFSGLAPSSSNGTFTVRGNAVMGRSVTVFAPRSRNKYSLTVSGDGTTASPALRWSADAATVAALRGKTVTVSTRVFVPAEIAGDATRGRLSVQTNGTMGGSTTSIPRETDNVDWVWRVLSGVKVPVDTEFFWIHVSADDSGMADRITYIDQIVLTVGDYPGRAN